MLLRIQIGVAFCKKTGRLWAPQRLLLNGKRPSSSFWEAAGSSANHTYA
jgi:hypothetical protein